MRSPGIVVVVDGPIHVGRRTTVAGLQRAWPEVRSGPLLAVGLDAAMRALGPASRRWAELVQPHATGRGDGAGHVTWGPLGREVVVGVAGAAAAWARAGFDVAVELVLPDRATLTEVTAALEGLFVLHVGLVCDPDVLEDRERELGVSKPGTAVAQLHATAGVAERDLVLDTSESTTDELVATVLTELRRRARG
jgi:chloramphenicol 3-O phosphotransferase